MTNDDDRSLGMINLFKMINLSVRLKHYLHPRKQAFSFLCIGLLSIFCLGACTQVPGGLEPPPPPNDPNLSAANQAFIKGDWDTLKALLSRLPGDGALLSQSLFYQAVILGFEKPKRAAENLKALQLGNDKRLRQRATLYRLLFKARAGQCLLTEGPLRRVYWPKAKTLPKGTRLLLEEALRGCDERNQAQHDKVKRLDHNLKANDRPTLSKPVLKSESSPSTETSTSVTPTSETVERPQLETDSSKKNLTQASTSTQAHLNHLTTEQRRGVTPYLQLWLPLTASTGQKGVSRSPLNILLAESAPLFVDQREEQGERVELERLDIQMDGKDSVSTRVAELRSEVDALLVVTPTKALHKEVLASVKTQQRPLFIFTPYALTEEPVEQSVPPSKNLKNKNAEDENTPSKNVESKIEPQSEDGKITPNVEADSKAEQEAETKSKEAPVWRIFPDKKLITRSLAKIAGQHKSQGIGILLPEGPVGQQFLKDFQREFEKLGQQNIKHRVLSSNENWEMLAQELRKWPVDTFIFTPLASLSVTSLVTHLASKGVWSASGKRFSQNIDMEAEAGEDIYRRFILWPNLYDQAVLDQVGRYLEGARTVSPVFKESESFKALDQKLLKEVGRGAQILDALMQDVLLFVDEAIRLSEVKQIALDEAFTKLSVRTKYLIKLDFTQRNALEKLYDIEVHDQQFRLFEASNESEVTPDKAQENLTQTQSTDQAVEDLNKKDAQQAD